MPLKDRKYIRTLLLALIVTLTSCAAWAAAKDKDFVVVIDAGHGGKDAGATEGRYVEKDINLQVALRIQEKLKKKKGFKVILTRQNDKYMNLASRAEKANKEKADLFISIHTNSLERSDANRGKMEGSIVYVHGENNTTEDLKAANRENANEEEEDVTIDIDALKDQYSAGFAGEVLQQLVKTATRKDRGVRQADFLVLSQTRMPSVLVELDFLCSQHSAIYLNSSAGQNKLAQAITNAIVTYRDTIRKKGASAYSNVNNADDNSDIYVLRAQKRDENKRINSAPNVSNKSAAKNSNVRKRRNAASKRISSARSLETDHIAIHSESPTTVYDNSTTQSSGATNIASVSKELTSAKVEKKREEKYPKTQDKSQNKKTAAANPKETSKQKQKSTPNGEERIFNGKKVQVSTPSRDNPRSLKSQNNTAASEKSTVVKSSTSDWHDKMKSVSDNQRAEANNTESIKQEPRQSLKAKKTDNESKTEKTDKKQKSQKEAKSDKTIQTKNNKTNNDKSTVDNRQNYEAAKQKSIDKSNDDSTRKSLKARKRN